MEKRIVQKTLKLAEDIQQVPAPTFAEQRRAEFLKAIFEKENLLDVAVDAQSNVFGRLPGIDASRFLVVSAHLDTVFPEETDLTLTKDKDTIAGPGIGDNSVAVASLLGLVWAIRSTGRPLPVDVWLVGNVGEEGLGDLAGMRTVVERFGDQPLAYIVLEGMGLGRVYYQGLGVRRYRVTVNTPGGHSWVNYGQPSAIHHMAELIAELTSIKLPNTPRTTMNVGIVSGGTSINTIASQASFELDLRSVGEAALQDLDDTVLQMIGKRNDEDVSYQVEQIGNRPMGEISPSHRLIEAAKRALLAVDLSPDLNIGSTDANIPLSQGLPAVCIGLTTGAKAHTIHEYIHTQPYEKGLAQLVNLVQAVSEFS